MFSGAFVRPFGKRAFYPLPEPVETAFDNSTRLVVEADVSSQAASGDVTSLVGYVSPDTLDRHIPIALFERLKAQLVRLRIPTAAVQPMKPFVAGGFLSVVEFSRLGYDVNLGVDAYLFSRARQAKKPIEELESALAGSTNVNPAVEKKLLELGELRVHCQAQMLQHFVEVSQAMPPEQGRRYLAEMQRLTLGFHEQIEQSMSAPAGHEHQH